MPPHCLISLCYAPKIFCSFGVIHLPRSNLLIYCRVLCLLNMVVLHGHFQEILVPELVFSKTLKQSSAFPPVLQHLICSLLILKLLQGCTTSNNVLCRMPQNQCQPGPKDGFKSQFCVWLSKGTNLHILRVILLSMLQGQPSLQKDRCFGSHLCFHKGNFAMSLIPEGCKTA